MKKILRKIFFPFYNSTKHRFLTKKWWFRAITVIFMAVSLFSIPYLWVTEVQDVYDDCMKTMSPKGLDALLRQKEGSEQNENELEATLTCNQRAKEAWTYPGIIQMAVINPIIIFYLSQFIFFIIIVNYIVLGGKKSKFDEEKEKEK